MPVFQRRSKNMAKIYFQRIHHNNTGHLLAIILCHLVELAEKMRYNEIILLSIYINIRFMIYENRPGLTPILNPKLTRVS